MKWFLSKLYVFIFISFFPLSSLAVDYVPLVGIPGLNDAGNMTTENYINALYVLAISVAAFLAVGRLIFAGVKYIATDIVPGKEQAKKDIKNALLGLLVVIGAVLILNTINPQLTTLDALSRMDTVSAPIQQVSVVKEEVGESIGPYSSPEDIKAFQKACTDNGKIFVLGSVRGGARGPVGTAATCYENPNAISAKIGDRLNLDDYPPDKQEEASTKFSTSCSLAGGEVKALLISTNDFSCNTPENSDPVPSPENPADCYTDPGGSGFTTCP